MWALQDLVPNTDKTDRATMLDDDILDYIKFLRPQVKVLSMSRLVGTGSMAQLIADIPLLSVEGEACESRSNQLVWEKWSTDGTEQQVAKLMEEDTEAAMPKAFCLMPISLAPSTYYRHHQPKFSTNFVSPEPNVPS